MSSVVKERILNETCGQRRAAQNESNERKKYELQAARVIGNATATVKHPSLDGWRLIALQPLDIKDQPDGFPFLAIDNLGAGKGDMIFFTSDGKRIREMVGRNDCPIRYAVQGIIDT